MVSRAASEDPLDREHGERRVVVTQQLALMRFRHAQVPTVMTAGPHSRVSSQKIDLEVVPTPHSSAGQSDHQPSDQQDGAERVAALYARLGAPAVLTDAASAELVKYAANCFLAMKLSYVNAIAELCERLDYQIEPKISMPHFAAPLRSILASLVINVAGRASARATYWAS